MGRCLGSDGQMTQMDGRLGTADEGSGTRGGLRPSREAEKSEQALQLPGSVG